MADRVIVACGLTKNYGRGRGIFDVDLEIERGEAFGIVGINGAGKTTTLRHLMGFVKSDAGTAKVLGRDAWEDAAEIKKHVSYVPGEIAFPSLRTGTAFLKAQAEYLGITDFARMNHLAQVMQLDPSADLKRMSKGMKQKTAIVAALMADREILILDEPTTGLDPLMREAFLDLVREEKAKGRTVLMSSHIFKELEGVCDRVAMIKEGRIIDTEDMRNLTRCGIKTFRVTFADQADLAAFTTAWGDAQVDEDGQPACTVRALASDVGRLFQMLEGHRVASLHERSITLEDRFMQVYEKGSKQ